MIEDYSRLLNNLSQSKRELLLEKLRERAIRSSNFNGIAKRLPGMELPLSFAQGRLWFLDQLESNSVFYTIVAAVQLRGSLNLEALEQSLNIVVKRHESLRTIFVGQGDNLQQHIVEDIHIAIPLLDLSLEPVEQREALLREQVHVNAQRPFDLAQGPLLRCSLFRLGDQEYVLSLIIHHIVADGWSVGILVHDLSICYATTLQGQTPDLPALPIQYADYALWQRKRLQGEYLQQQLSYWQHLLAGAPALLDLPTDHPRPPLQSYRGARETFHWEASLSEHLKSFCQQEKVTPFMVLFAAWATLLARWSGQEDVVIGTPIAGRQHVELESLIGFFVNTLALRVHIEASVHFRAVVQQVREVALGAYAHQELPFEKLVEVLAPQRDLSHHPLFQVMFILQNTPASLPLLPNLSIEPLAIDNQTARFDLELLLVEGEDHLEGHLEYSTDLFEASTIQRLIQQLEGVLQAGLQHPEQSLASRAWLTPQEYDRIVHQWNATQTTLPEPCQVVALFEAQVARTPEQVALFNQQQQMSYAQLNAQANQLARLLQARGVQAEQRVGLLLERSPLLVVAQLAVLKAGAAYVPVDPMLPPARILFMLTDAQAQLVLTQRSLALPETTSWPCPHFQLDEPASLWQQGNASNLNLPIAAQQAAYVIYTSGSTGTPKGVIGLHQGLVNRVRWMWHAFPFEAGECCCQKTSVSFVDAVAELFTPLLAGVPTLVLSQAISQDPAQFVAALAHGQVSRLVLVPSLLRLLLETEEHLGQRLPRLRSWYCSGETLPADLVQRFAQQMPGCQLFNIYGSSEVAADATVCQLDLTAGAAIPSNVIGRPLENVEIYVLDAQGQPVPLGWPGEIYVGGLGLARGYVQGAAETAERFVPDPFSGQAGARLYRTGDRGRWRENGELEYLGRRDRQVKLRGIRIEPGEIEAVLHEVQGVRQAVVQVQAGGSEQDGRLVAYVELEQGEERPAEEIRRTLQERVPGYLVPNHVIVVQQWPLTSSGKVDRAALPRWQEAGERQGGYVAPTTVVEETLVEIWQEVLQVAQVGITDSFFALGGHSLLAMQVLTQVRARFQVELPLRHLFEEPTIAALAHQVEHLLQQEPEREGVEQVALVPVDRSEHLPLSFMQERLWFLQQLEPQSTAYHIVLAVRLRGSLDQARLEESFVALIQRHESLRTVFVLLDGQPQQRIAEHGPLDFSLYDLSAELADERTYQATQRVLAHAQEPFDLAQGPLLRVQLLRVAPQEQILSLVIHHSIADGWSMSVLIRDLVAIYLASLQGQTPELPALPIQYADYALWQRKRLQGEYLQQQLSYWQHLLTGAPALLDLPTDHPRPAVSSYRGAKLPVFFSQEVNEQLKSFCQQEKVTPFMVLFAAWATLLARWSGQEDVVIGTPIAGRQRVELEPLIGFFVNTLALRVHIEASARFRAVVQQVREVALGAYAHQELPFEKLVEVLAPQRDLSHHPLFQVMFILQNASLASTPVLSNLHIEPLAIDAQTAKFDLELSLTEGERHLEGYLEYNTDLFEVSTIQQVVHLLEQVLLDGLKAPEQAVAALDCIPLAHQGPRLQVHGYRLGLGELTQAIKTLLEVQEVELRLRTNESDGSESLLAYIVPKPAAMLTAEQVQRYLRAHLPRYQVPDECFVLDGLPRTVEGSIDWSMLPVSDHLHAHESRALHPPRTDLEAILVSIWCEVLHREEVGIFDDFFELGGHSLLATQVVARVEEVLASQLACEGAELEGVLISTLFEEPTIAALAHQLEHLMQQEPEAEGVEQVALVPVDRSEHLPLSFMQERLWFLQQLEPQSTAYHIVLAVRLRGSLDQARLEESFVALIQRHESLRTVFVLLDGQPQQRIAEHGPLDFSLHDLSAEPPEERDRQSTERVLAHAQEPFDLAQGPLLRVQLLRVAPQEQILSLVIHHSIADGWSMSVLIRDLVAIYLASLQGQTPELPALPIQYADYALWQRKRLQGEYLQQQLSYWQHLLTGAPALLDLPTDHPRPAVSSYRGAKLPVFFSQEVSEHLKSFCQQEKVTPFMVLFAAWATLLARWSGQEDLVIGTPIAGRQRVELEPLIGFFVNTLALRVHIEASAHFRAVVQQVREVALGAYAHQELPFEKLVEVLAPQRDLSHHPLFQVMFILQNTPTAAMNQEYSSLSIEPFETDTQTAKFDLELSLTEGERHLEGYLEYNTDLFEVSTIQQVVHLLEQVLLDGLKAPEQAVAALDCEPLAHQQAARGPRLQVHGYRLGLAELTQAIKTLLEVQEVELRLRTNESDGSESLLAYIVPKPAAMLTAEQVQRYLRAHLPRYQVPDECFVLDGLPRTVEGSIDWSMLPVSALSHDHESRALHPPRTQLEAILVSIWCEVLHREEVGIFDDFFELGGHSLLATQVVARVEEVLASQLACEGAELEGVLISTLFEEPTIAALAHQLEHLMQQEPEAEGVEQVALVPVDRSEHLPLSFMQERLWFLQQLEPQSTAYHIVLAVRLRGSLDQARLEESFVALIQRHESLRTVFVLLDGQPQQRIAEHGPLDFSLHDLSAEPPEERDRQSTERVLAHAQEPFDLAQGPLLRVQLLRVAPQEQILSLVIHHSIADGWSMSVLIRDLVAIYLASLQGQTPELPALPIQYADYALWQRKRLQGEYLQQQLSYWQHLLTGAPALLDLPTDHPRPAVSSYRGAKLPVFFSQEVNEQLKSFCQQEKVTPFMVLFAAWATLLARWSGQEDVVIGTPIAGRQRVELEPLIGFFVNTLALRVHIEASAHFRAVVQQVREVALGAYAHQELPFEKLVEVLAPQRDLSHHPLFQVMFILQNTPTATLVNQEHSPLRIEPFETDTQTAKFDLTLELQDASERISGHLEYSTDLFEASTIQRLIQQLEGVLQAGLQHPEQSLASRAWLTPQEYDRIVHQWNATQTTLPEPCQVVALFEAQVARTPEQVALFNQQQQMSYAQLNAQANQLARLLQARGVQAEQRVGLLLERSPLLVVAQLAVLKAGAAYVPVDPMLPPARILFMLTDAQAQLVLTQRSLALPETTSWPCPQFQLDEPTSLWQQGNASNLNLPIAAQQAAYVIYTSGSTGTPKGVIGLHQGLVNRVRWMWHAFPFEAGECCCQKTSVGFVDAVAELFTPLLAGVPTLVLSQAISQDPAQFVAALAHGQVSRLVLVPSLLRLLLETEEHLGQRLPRLRSWYCSGETFPTDLVQRFAQQMPGCQLFNIYGSSEVAADATVCQLDLTAGAAIPSNVIGRPLENVEIYVLDAQGQPVPLGWPGEIYVGGLGLARGYVQGAAETAERFVPDPFSGQAGARLYRTGDRGRWRENGELEYLGRRDRQVKLRGIRIEPGEIEAVLHEVQGVRQAVVQVQVQAGGSEQDGRLVVYVELEQGEERPAEEIRRTLQERVPGYLVPNHVVVVEQWPLTSSGKVDRAALPRWQEEAGERQGGYVAPTTVVEETLVEIWQEVLQVAQVGITDSFFALGGHSLLAMQVLTQVRARFQVELPLRHLFEEPTIADLATIIVQEQVQQVDSDVLAQMLDEVTQLSADELQAMLLGSTDDAEESNIKRLI